MLLYKEIEQYLIKLILENSSTKENEKLPSEQQLVSKFNASRISVRKAYESLENKKYVYRIKGKGAFINKDRKPFNNKFNFALILPSPETQLIKDIIFGINKFCEEFNSSFITLFYLHSSYLEKEKIEYALNLHFNNIILFPDDNDLNTEYVSSLINSGINIVFIDRNINDKNNFLISSNHFEIGYTATKYLIEKGHSNIAFNVVTKQTTSTIERSNGYEKAQLDLLHSLNTYYILDTAIMDNCENIKEYINTHPQITALITNSGNSLNMIIPFLFDKSKIKNFDIVAIDDELIINNYNKRIAKIIQDGVKIGYTAANCLYQKYNHLSHSRVIYIPFNLSLN